MRGDLPQYRAASATCPHLLYGTPNIYNRGHVGRMLLHNAGYKALEDRERKESELLWFHHRNSVAARRDSVAARINTKPNQ